MICKTKIDSFFPIEQFIIEGYATTYRLDKIDGDGGQG